jgi:hypothetical protein
VQYDTEKYGCKPLLLGTEWWSITQAKLDQLIVEYPNALPNGQDYANDFERKARLRDVREQLRKIEDPAKYGQGLQQEIEAAARKHFAKWHDEETRKIAEREEQEKARLESDPYRMVVRYFTNIDGFDGPRWRDAWGPYPLQPGCMVPDAVIIRALTEWMHDNWEERDFRLTALSDERFAAITVEAFSEGMHQHWHQQRERESDEQREQRVRKLLAIRETNRNN